ncbi:MAG: glycosyltransferase family 2 protein [Actinomycetota bacterium]|nr:glycosyltransferase family 2 protein [Actinomycetota bacterium]
MIIAVVLTYDAPEGMLRDAVSSVIAGAGVQRVIVVDNGARAQQSLAGLHDGAVPLQLVVTGRNLGFAGGMNVGIDLALQAGADAVVVLNDDVVVQPGWIEILAAELQRDATIGGVQPKLLFADREPPTVNSVGVRIGPDGAGTDIGYGEPDDGRFDEPTDVEACTGGALLLRSAMLREVGSFDERLFMYYEDVDLCRRAAVAGWRFRCVPAARVWHRGGATSGSVPTRMAYYRERNRIWLLFRWARWPVVSRGLWLSVRRVRHAPRRVHARALLAGLGGAPRQLAARWTRPRG